MTNKENILKFLLFLFVYFMVISNPNILQVICEGHIYIWNSSLNINEDHQLQIQTLELIFILL